MNKSGTSRGTVLVVDRDPAVLVLMQKLLASQDYRVLLAANWTAAMFLIRQSHVDIDVALLDMRVPGISRTGLADEIQSIRPKMRVLWISAFVDGPFIRVKLAGERSAGLLAAVAQAMEVPKSMTAGG
ncbi:MAG: response regulator [Bryobacteraceae bacterium]